MTRFDVLFALQIAADREPHRPSAYVYLDSISALRTETVLDPDKSKWACVYLDPISALRTEAVLDPDKSRWADVYLDNALDLLRRKDPGYKKRSFSGHLSALRKEGFYEPQSDPYFKGHWGLVRADVLVVLSPQGEKV